MATTITTNTKEPLQSQQRVISSSSSMAVEDESLKRNTDCVYFLASPLTCKKGSECEYRHSEYARVNPTDCRYWLNGNCLNPKCSYRHPPLDCLVGPQTENFAGPSVVPLAAPVPTTPQNPTKQGVPCIFFQKGYCLKGDRCPFMHAPNPVSTKTQQVPASNVTPEAPVFNKSFGSLENCAQPKGKFHVIAPKVVKAPAQANVTPKVQSARSTNGQPVGRGYRPPSGVIKEAHKYEGVTSPADNGNLRSRTGSAFHGGSSDDLTFQNDRDADDSLRESSPGFDVLVDDKLSDDEVYNNEDQYVRMRGREGRDLNEFDLVHQDDYNSVADVDPEIYHNLRGYDSFDRVLETYPWDHRRASSERSLVDPAHYDRRCSYNKSQSSDIRQSSDLRQRLSSKQRRVNGLKSVVNPDCNIDDHAKDRGYRGTRRDSRRSPVHETSRSQRLQGRIKLPRSSPMSGNNTYSERESERGRNWGRLSPTRHQVSSQQGLLRDRLSGRSLEESREGRRITGTAMINDTFPANDSNFAGPKRLSELKGTKQTDTRQHQIISQQSVAGGKLRDTILASSFGTDGDLSFEGPKPLSEILKRKRTGPTGDTISNNKEQTKQQENDMKLTNNVSKSSKYTGKQVTLPSAVEQAPASEVVNKPVASEADDEEGEISNKKAKLNGEGESSVPIVDDDNKHPEVQEDEVAADGEEQEFEEEYNQQDGEYEYGQDDGEEYHLNEVEHEGDSMDEDDGDDFAKTLGVSL